MTGRLSIYTDENVDVRVAARLHRREVDAVSVYALSAICYIGSRTGHFRGGVRHVDRGISANSTEKKK